MMALMTYLAFIEGLGEKGLMPLQNTSGVRKLIQLLDVIVLDIGPDHDDHNDGGDDGENDDDHDDGNSYSSSITVVIIS